VLEKAADARATIIGIRGSLTGVTAEHAQSVPGVPGNGRALNASTELS
jgi:hypothetical protein